MSTAMIFTKGRWRYEVSHGGWPRGIVRHFWTWRACERYAAQFGREAVLLHAR